MLSTLWKKVITGIKPGEIQTFTSGQKNRKPQMSLELKIKSKHLAEEAKIIRFEENKLKGQIKWHCKRQSLDPRIEYQYMNIHNHRVWDVRNECRATQLARAYIAGRPYKSVEHKRRDSYMFREYIVPRIVEMVKKYGSVKVDNDAIWKWSDL